MLANGAFPNEFSPEELDKIADEALDMYYRHCSTLVNLESLARWGAMCANDGINPTTGERIIKQQTVKHVVTVTATTGM